MVDIPLFLNSVDGEGKSHDFTIKYIPEIILDPNKKYCIALDKVNMSYSWYVTIPYNNRKLKYSHNKGTTWTEIILVEGNYDYEGLTKAIQREINKNGHSKQDKDIEIDFVFTTFRCMITLHSDFQLDLRDGKFNELIGFKNEIVTSTKIGENLPNITNSVDEILIHCSLISESNVSGRNRNVLYLFSTDSKHLSYPFEVNPRRAMFSKINTSTINEIRIYVTDSLNRIVDLNGISMSLTLMLRIM